MTKKVRHIDYHPDEFIAGVAGQLDPDEVGVYWVICSQQYSKGGPIDDDAMWLSRMFRTTHWRTVRAILDRLIAKGKVVQEGGKIWVKRAAEELQASQQRVSKAAANGALGGRPLKQNNDLTKPDGFPPEKLTTNHQPPTTNKRDASASSSKDFDQWYAGFPHKVGRRQAEKAFASALRRAKDLQVLIDGLERYIKAKPPDRSWCNPATWLNGDRWLDEMDQGDGKTEQTDTGNSSSFADELLRRHTAAAKERRERLESGVGGDAGALLPAVSG